MNKIFIYGSGAHGRVVLDILRAENKNCNISFIDDNSSIWGEKIQDVPIIGGKEYLLNQNFEDIGVIIAIANPFYRKNIFDELNNSGIKFINAIHPSVIISPTAQLGINNVIYPGARICNNAKIGNNVIICTSTVIEHDNIIEDYVGVSSGVQTGGRVIIKNSAFICISAVIISKVSIGTGSIVGAGALVTKNVESYVLVRGFPAKVVEVINEDFNWGKIF